MWCCSTYSRRTSFPKNKRGNDNLEQQAQALFKDWCDGCTETVEIGQIATNVLDYTPNRNKQVRLINSSDITEGIFGEYPLVENINLKGHFKKRFKKGDILYSEIRPRNHHYGYVLFDGDEYVISTRLMVIRNIPLFYINISFCQKWRNTLC